MSFETNSLPLYYASNAITVQNQCCKDKKLAKKIKILAEINKSEKCINCLNDTDLSFILRDYPTKCMIYGFRCNLVKVYKQANV
jgi:hypothetical protein